MKLIAIAYTILTMAATLAFGQETTPQVAPFPPIVPQPAWRAENNARIAELNAAAAAKGGKSTPAAAAGCCTSTNPNNRLIIPPQGAVAVQPTTSRLATKVWTARIKLPSGLYRGRTGTVNVQIEVNIDTPNTEYEGIVETVRARMFAKGDTVEDYQTNQTSSGSSVPQPPLTRLPPGTLGGHFPSWFSVPRVRTLR